MPAMEYLDANDYVVETSEVIAKALAAKIGITYDRDYALSNPLNEDQDYLRTLAEAVFLALIREGRLSVSVADLGSYASELDR